MAKGHPPAAIAVYVNPSLFFAFVVIGCGYILIAKFSGFSALAVTSVPVIVMLVYAASVKFVGAVRLRDDQAGDNLYYLGFLYTLTSLGVSLYQFRADGPAEEIVQNFGVAIGSTIAGVALRVLFNQMRRDPDDVEQAARIELSEAARRMRRELDATVVELAHFRRSAQQQVSEGFEYVREGMEEVSGRILTSFEEMTLRASKPFESASESSGAVLSALAKTIGESLDGAAKRLADENEKLAAETGEITLALRTTAERLSAMQTPDKIIEVRFEPIAASLASTMEGFAEHIRRKDEIDRGVIEAITRSGSQHQKQATMLANLTKALEKRTEAMVASEERADSQSVQALRILEGMERNQSRALDAQAERDQQMQELREMTARLSAVASDLNARTPEVDDSAERVSIEDESARSAMATMEEDLSGHFKEEDRLDPPPIKAVR
ncbi:hypothetical protein [Aurantimonas sp. C2-4-R8]|nr:hypothetical protein [Aurantimonas sp. C2-3-R2]